jgi:predicted ATP-dependent endonuclease of OLD family
MKLVTFSVKNFRSITKAHKIPINEISVLIGKNNEGKSNLLKALNIAMTHLRKYSEIRSERLTRYSSYRSRNTYNNYNWERDFPISYQNRRTGTDSTFRLEFELTETEVTEFKKEIKSNLNGTLPIELKIGKKHDATISVIKKGRGSKTLNSKSKQIAEYIAKRINFNYIPAIRTDKEAMRVVDSVLTKELEKLESQPEYENALKTIRNLQAPVLEELSKTIMNSLTELLPYVKDVTIEFHEYQRRLSYRQQFEIFVDDGNNTSLEFKGDGVKSLAAMGLLKDMQIRDGVVSVIAIEEPESHLHPGAIHILKDTIFSLASSNQVIVSTHNPLFVDRENITSNIVVDSGNVRPAKNINEIRTLLGIKASDNLQNANYALVVEGEEDVKALKAILPMLSDKIKKALKDNLLIIEKIGGAGNLSYKLSLIKQTLCLYHVLLDNDEAGRDAYDKANISGELNIANVTFTNCQGMQNSEFEDCLDLVFYKDDLEAKYLINLDVPQFRCNNKWSDRMKAVFQSQGKPWSDRIESQLKDFVSSLIVNNPANSLHNLKRNSIDALIYALELIIK